MHLGVVPITADRLSAKTLFDKKELTSIQTDFAKQVGERYGLERGKGERTHPLDRNTLQASASRAEIGTRCKQYDHIRSTATEIGDKGKEELARLRALQEEQESLRGANTSPTSRFKGKTANHTRSVRNQA